MNNKVTTAVESKEKEGEQTVQQFQIVLTQKQLVRNNAELCYLVNEFMHQFRVQLADSYDAEFMMREVPAGVEELEAMWENESENSEASQTN